MQPRTRLQTPLVFVLYALMAVAAASQQVPDDAADVRPLDVGERAPAFEAPAPDGSVYAFHPDELDRPAILIFYRGGWCPYCNSHLAELRDAVPKLQDAGYEVLFLSADRPSRLRASLEEPDLDYRLLSDASMAIARDWGIAFRVDDETAERYRSLGIDLAAASGYDHQQLPVPSVFLVDGDGFVRFRYVNPDYRERLSAEALLEAAGVD
ncbi:peroxiredoxin-like family protein [Lentisalinibacter salinarum]|uniref:peroxiredoxin-like family protein n=1 Tax=Lentisalinibacter salinarum TaxID=2992239 RepID=UPI0038663155